MHKSEKDYAEIITEEMKEFAELVIKYSPSQLAAMVAAVDLDNLQYEMEANGATRDEVRATSECHNDFHEMLRMCGLCN